MKLLKLAFAVALASGLGAILIYITSLSNPNGSYHLSIEDVEALQSLQSGFQKCVVPPYLAGIMLVVPTQFQQSISWSEKEAVNLPLLIAVQNSESGSSEMHLPAPNLGAMSSVFNQRIPSKPNSLVISSSALNNSCFSLCSKDKFICVCWLQEKLKKIKNVILCNIFIVMLFCIGFFSCKNNEDLLYSVFVLSRGSIGNNLSTSEVEERSVYTLISLDPTLWDYTGYVVDFLLLLVVIVFMVCM